MGGVVSEQRLTNRWLVLVLIFGIALLNYADRYLLSGLVGPIKAEFGLTDGFMGLLLGPSFALIYTVAAIPIARLADRTSRIVVICAGCALWSFFTAITAYATSGWLLALARLGVGIGEAAYQAPAAALIAAYFPAHQRTRALAVLGSTIYFGQMTGMAGGPAIAAHYGWRAAFEMLGGVGIVVAVTAWLVIREPAKAAAGGVPRVPLMDLARQLSRTASVRNMTIAAGFGTLSGVTFGLWGPALFERAYDLSSAEAGKAFGLAFGLPGLVGTLVFGVLADRMAKRGPEWPLRLTALALAAATACIMVATWMPSLALAQAVAIPSGLLGGGWSVGVIASLQYVLPERNRSTGTAMAMLIVGLFGNFFGPWIAGLLSDLLGDAANGAWGLRAGLSIIMPTGFIGAWLAWRASRMLEQDQRSLSA
jgi:MFS family permease